MLQEHDSRAISDTEIRRIENLERLDLISRINPKLSKDGDKFCYLLGDNLQEGIAGFGNTVYDAMVDFCHVFYSEMASNPLGESTK